MTTVNKRIQKRKGPGRPPKPGGPDQAIPVRLPKAVIAEVDHWAKREGVGSRSEAFRRLIQRGLKK